MFQIEMLPAGHGDCFLINYGDAHAPKHILIDGGPYYFFTNRKSKQIGKHHTLYQRLMDLAHAGGQLELLVITHVDGDHIEAVVKWLGNQPGTLAIQDIWFNGRHHLEPGWLGPIQGEFLAKQIGHYQLAWNERFDRKTIVCDPQQIVERTLDGGMRLTVLSPTWDDLIALRKEWDAVLEEEELDTDDPQAILARLEQDRRLAPSRKAGGWLGVKEQVNAWADAKFNEDSTPPNGSSIALLAEYDGKAALFAGDAHPSTLTASLRQLLRSRQHSRLEVDAFKVPHHGSQNNLTRELLELLVCRRYLISTNGSYFKHPDPQAIARILKYGTLDYGKRSFTKPVLCFNYQKPRMTAWNKSDFKRAYYYETLYPPQSGEALVIDL